MKTYIKAAELLFKKPTIVFSCHAIEYALGIPLHIRSIENVEFSFYSRMFNIANIFESQWIYCHKRKLFQNPNPTSQIMLEIRLLALCLAQAAYDDDPLQFN